MSNGNHIQLRPLIIGRRPVRVISKRVAIVVYHDQVTTRALDEFIEFLKLVYDTNISVTQKDDKLVWISFIPHGMSETGLRVASWLYSIPYEVVAWPY